MCFLLRAAGHRAAGFASAQAFLDDARRDAVECVVADIRMPGMSGMELLARLAGELPGLPVILVTGHGDVPLAVRAMKAGAVDFLGKPVQDAELLAALDVAMKRRVAERAVAERARSARARLARLTAREREVLDAIVAGAPNKRIAHALGISEKTVEAHRARVMEKMEATSLAGLVRDALHAGVSAAAT
ncbi:MAG: response regulator transcription factor [Alphaproteobacteria bacterium]|nr:response regulator transcription factor [Alphaproteobacteria bacterium]